VWLVRVSERMMNPHAADLLFRAGGEEGASKSAAQRLVDVSEGGLAH